MGNALPGNVLSGNAPGQILPVENYLTDLNSKGFKVLEIERSLGSTRFLKVVMCLSDGGPIVIKVFVIHDSSLPLLQQSKIILLVAKELSSAANCLPFHRVELTERAAFIIRQYKKCSLYDRISTRPFLCLIEKKWLAFQLLCGLNQCHQKKICHGDIKLENLLVSSWSWLMITDFATFKPVLLPEAMPADFTFFFDTSRRRVCTTAPERFIKIQHKEEDQLIKELKDKGTELTPAMDIFSAGCVLAELFTEGVCPFSLMQLLQYKVGNYSPDKVLNKISDERMKAMIKQMILKDPNERQSAVFYLEQERGKFFPEHFYSFLWPYCKQFVSPPGIPADERIVKIAGSLPDILVALGVDDISEQPEVEEANLEAVGKAAMPDLGEAEKSNIEESQITSQVAKLKINGEEEKNPHLEDNHEKTCDHKSDSMIIITSLIKSSIRTLQLPSSKLLALDLLKKVSNHVPDDIILDRIVPYIFSLLKDNEPRVRAESVFAITHCLSMVKSVPRSEINIFPEYIFPHLNDVTQDEAVIVRQAEAENIATIADTGQRFVEYCLQKKMIITADVEIETLQEIIQQKLAKLFSDTSNSVKRTLIEETMNTLCLFFGREKANDILLSHFITYLNEKKDHHLRIAFFKNITGIAAYMGGYCSPILKPLLLQGLSDTEELVIISALDTLSTLTQIGTFPDYILRELVGDTVPLLIHPNTWIKLAVVAFIATVSKVLRLLDVLTTVADEVKPYSCMKIRQFDKEECILRALRFPIPRDAYEVLIKSSDVLHILNILEEGVKQNTSIQELSTDLVNVDQQTRNILRRLAAGGITAGHVQLMLLLKDHLVKVQKYKKTMETIQSIQSQNAPGSIELDKDSQPVLTHHYKLVSNEGSIDISDLDNSSEGVQNSASLTMNEEWQTMFGNASPEDSEQRNSTYSANKPLTSAASSSQSILFDQPPEEGKGYEKPGTECQRELQTLLSMKREELLVSIQSHKAANSANFEGAIQPDKWRPKGHLVAHLQEHRAPITRLIPLTGKTLYASASKDGIVKIWDCNKTERTYPVNRSKCTYQDQKGTITSIAYCSMQESIASSSDNGSICVSKVDKQSLLASRQLDRKSDGYVIDMHYMEAGAHSVLTYSTVYGEIVGWDLRSPGNAWVAKNSVRKGVIMSYAVNASNNWLACGTSSGYHICWDLRFMLPISQLKHPQGQGVQKIKMHPSKQSMVISSMRGSNEVVFWDMETQSRMKTLWANSGPPFKFKRGSSTVDNWICSLVASQTEKGVFVITVGTDSRIRYWDIDVPEASYIISHQSLSNGQCHFSYMSRVIDGSEVIIENMSPNPADKPQSDESPKRCPDQPPTGHIETITDIIMVNQPQKMLITSGYDGTIKMWK